MTISPNFTLAEFIDSNTAKLNKIDNTPNDLVISNLNLLCMNVLEPLRALLNQSIIISSGYRCKELNKLVGGSKTSQHLEGKAADISCKSLTTEQLYQFIINSKLKYDQIIQEFDRWVHISWNNENNRNEKLRAIKENSKVIYIKQ